MSYSDTTGYDVKGRFASYWHQKDEISRLNPRSLLECGIGRNFLYRYFQGSGIHYVTLDLSPTYIPTIVGSVRNIPKSQCA